MPKAIFISSEMIEKIKLLRSHDRTLRFIGKELGVSRQTITRSLQKIGESTDNLHHISDDIIYEIAVRRTAGEQPEDLCKEFGYSIGAVCSGLTRLGLGRPSPIIICKMCGVELTKENTYSNGIKRSDIRRGKRLCKTCYNQKKELLKIEVFNTYGGKCTCCGTNLIEFLTIDHIDGSREEGKKRGGNHLYTWLKRNNYPKMYRVLCISCNNSMGQYGYCPHNSLIKHDDEKHENGDIECKKCKEKLSISCFYKSNGNVCKYCLSIGSAQSRRKEKEKLITEYGGKCVCCAEIRLELLTINHKNGGGHQHIQQLKKNGTTLYPWLKKNNYPKDEYELMCMNCNFAEGIHGGCPHKQEALCLI